MANVHFDSTFTKEQFHEQVRSDFTKRAAQYDGESTGAMGPAMREDIITQLLNFYPPASPLLDVACGTGRLCGITLRLGCESTGLDLTPAMLAEARKNYPAANFVEGRAEELPFPDNSFASAYISSALVYFTDIPRSLREIWRVLKPGGYIAFQCTSGDSYIVGIAIQNACIRVLGENAAKKIFTVPSTVTDSPNLLEQLMDNAGFRSTIVNTSQTNPVLDVNAVVGTWKGGMFNNAFLTRFARLNEQQKDDIRKQFLICIENYRDDDGVLRDKIKHWFVKGYKPPVPSS